MGVELLDALAAGVRVDGYARMHAPPALFVERKVMPPTLADLHGLTDAPARGRRGRPPYNQAPARAGIMPV